MTNIKIGGIGGMGVLRASNILSHVLFNAGYDVKKAEVHGMSQRGGSISSDVRFGDSVASPMIPAGECDYLLVFTEDQLPVYDGQLRENGVLLTWEDVDESKLSNKKSLNIALLGKLNSYLKIDTAIWESVIRESFPEKLQQINIDAFHLGMK